MYNRVRKSHKVGFKAYIIPEGRIITVVIFYTIMPAIFCAVPLAYYTYFTCQNHFSLRLGIMATRLENHQRNSRHKERKILFKYES